MWASFASAAAERAALASLPDDVFDCCSDPVLLWAWGPFRFTDDTLALMVWLLVFGFIGWIAVQVARESSGNAD